MPLKEVDIRFVTYWIGDADDRVAQQYGLRHTVAFAVADCPPAGRQRVVYLERLVGQHEGIDPSRCRLARITDMGKAYLALAADSEPKHE